MDLTILCDSLSAMGPRCGPFHIENYRAQLLQLPATSWLFATPFPHSYISACGVDKNYLKWLEIQLAMRVVL